MATATSVQAADPECRRLIIQDSDNKVWTYQQGTQVPPPELVHVVISTPSTGFTPILLPFARYGEEAFLRQDGPGLPKTALVKMPGSGEDCNIWDYDVADYYEYTQI